MLLALAWLCLACSGAEGKKSVDSIDDTATADTGQDPDVTQPDSQEPDVAVPDDVQDPDVQPDLQPDLQPELQTDLLPDLQDPPDGCCWTGQDCDDQQVCVGADDGPWPLPGSCQPAPDIGQCWSDNDCTSPEDWCEGQVICGCGEKCALAPGWCLHTDPPFCCESDEQCFGDESCFGPKEQFEGICLADPGANTCFGDSHCEPGQSCQGASVPSCWSDAPLVPGVCLTMPDYCCLSDQDCDPGHTCTAANGPEEPGSCEQDAPPGKCWSGDDCNATEYCKGAEPCPCFMDCFAVYPGDCTPVTVDCCLSDDDCQPGAQCIKESNDYPGVCKEQPAKDHCWHDLHCKPGQKCQGAAVCPCDADCDGADMEGTCVETCDDADCCCQDADCGQDYTCVMLEQGNTCLPDMGQDMCWQDSDCGPAMYCHGAIPCPCDWDCDGDGWDIPGTCEPTGGDMCCMTDADCPQFFMGKPMVCLIQEGNPDVVGTCQQAPDPGACWSDDDCYMEQTCKDVYFCPCGMDCGWPGTKAGNCSPLPQGCCYDDAGCADGFVCKGFVEFDNMPGHCLPHPDGPACPFDAKCCWNNADCPGDSICKEAYFCGCIELCPVCGACAPDQIGYCQ